MKGWVTADVDLVIEIVGRIGRLRVLDDYDLVIEAKDADDLQALSENSPKHSAPRSGWKSFRNKN